MPRWLEPTLVTCALLLLAGASALWIYELGVEYDEAHFYPTAIEIAYGAEKYLPPPHGVTIAHRPIPFLTMPYVGTLDALLYAVPYAAFGSSPLVPRWTNVFLGALIFLLTWHVARGAAGPWAGLFALGLLLADLELLLHIPTNYGPLLLQQLFTMAGIAALLHWWKTSEKLYFFAAVAIFALAFHEKLTYFWILSSLAIASAIVYRREALRASRWWMYPAGLALALAILSPILYYTSQLPEVVLGFGKQSTGLRGAFGELLSQRWHSLDLMLRGTWMMEFTAGPVPEGLWRSPALLALFLASFFARHRTGQLCSLTALGVWLWNLVFPEAGRMHHVLLLAPLWQCAGGILFGISGKFVRAGLVLLLSVAIFDTARCLAWYGPRVAQTGGANHWSDMTAGAAQWLAARPELEGVALNWGIARTLFSLSGGKVEVTERAFDAIPSPEIDALLAKRRTVWLVSDVVPIYAERWRQLVERAASGGRNPRQVAVFSSRDRRFHLRAYRFDAEPAPLPLWREVEGNLITLPKNFDFVRLEVQGQAQREGEFLTVEWLDDRDEILFSDSRPLNWLPFVRPWHQFDFALDLYPPTFLRTRTRAAAPAKLRISSQLDRAKATVRLALVSFDVPQRPDVVADPPAQEPPKTFRIQLQKPLEELRRLADAATPPPQPAKLRRPDLVDLKTLSPTIRLDIRYATADNFMGAPMYTRAEAYLQRPAAQALLRVHQNLSALGYGLLIHDAYRPWRVTKMFWDATPVAQRNFVANPARGSRHNRGCAVDLSLYELASGKPVQMPSGFDEFSERAYPDYPGGTAAQRYHRGLLRQAMEAQGFTVNEDEWWHYDYKDWRAYPVLNLSFEQLSAR